MFLRGHFAPGIVKPDLFDGIDIDWEYPKAADAANYIALIAEFRRQMDLYRAGLRLSVAVGDSPRMYPDVDMAAVSRIADQIAVMTRGRGARPPASLRPSTPTLRTRLHPAAWMRRLPHTKNRACLPARC
jgi:hypothetical protein